MFCAYLTLILSAALLITACSGSGRPTETSTALDSIPIPAISEDTAPIHEPVFPAYPFSFFTEGGEEITVELPCDPEQYAELHACTLDDAGALYHAILYSVEPEEFPAEQEIVDWFITRYKLDEKNDVGNSLFSDKDIDRIIRVRYDMEVADFSIYNRYTFATDVDVSLMTYIKELHVVGADFEIETEIKTSEF